MVASVSKQQARSPRQASRRRTAVDRCLDTGLFKALGDPTRVKLLACLMKCGRACSVSELAACCVVDFSVVARHLGLLARAGVVTARKQGRTMWYQAGCSDLAARFRGLADAIDACCPASGSGTAGVAPFSNPAGACGAGSEACVRPPADSRVTDPASGKWVLFPEVASYVKARIAEFGQISPSRRASLEPISDYLRRQQGADRSAKLLFVCTHNSRRSQFAQIWATVGAQFYGIRLAAYSGGTCATAVDERTVAALERAGLRIEKSTDDLNAIYHVRFGPSQPALTAFSKRFDLAPNPGTAFAAVLVCDQADQACPYVAGAEQRWVLPYADPKESDGTSRELAVYQESCAQIAREMIFVIKGVINHNPSNERKRVKL